MGEIYEHIEFRGKDKKTQKRKKYDGTEKNTSYLYLSQLRTENQDSQGKRKN